MANVDSSQILGSWKEIAAYLGKGVRTVQRWELLHGLPVRRPKGAPRGVVYCSREELDQWLLTQWSQRHSEVHSDVVAWQPTIPTSELVLSSATLRHANRELAHSILQTVLDMRRTCALLAITTAESHKIGGEVGGMKTLAGWRDVA